MHIITQQVGAYGIAGIHIRFNLPKADHDKVLKWKKYQAASGSEYVLVLLPTKNLS